MTSGRGAASKAGRRIKRVERGLREFLDTHETSCVLLPRDAALANILLETKGWKSIYADDVAIVKKEIAAGSVLVARPKSNTRRASVVVMRAEVLTNATTVTVASAANLSVGERQLLSFARALAVDPALLVLDEATSSVDPHTERMVQAALERLLEGRTAVIVAKRFFSR